MPSLRRAVILLSVLLAADSALGQGAIAKIGKRAPEFEFKDTETKDIKFSLEKLRGRIILFYCWRTSSAESLELMARMHEIDSKYRERGVRIVGVCPEPKDKMEKALNEKGIGFFYDNIWQAALFQMAFGSMSHPEVVLIDPYGILVWRGHPLDNLEQRLDDILEHTPSRSGDKEWLAAQLRAAERLSAQGDYGRAYWMAKQVLDFTDEAAPEHGSAEGAMKQIEEAGKTRIPAALEAERAGDIKKAAELLADISVRMAKTDLAKAVDNEIGRMSGDRNLKVEIRKAVNNARGQVLLDEAAMYEEAGLFDRAIEIAQNIVEDEETYAETDALAQATAALERFKSDPKVRARVAERRAAEQYARWLDLGDRFAKAGLSELAREHYDKVIQAAADSKWGKRAAERVQKLPKAEASTGKDKPSGG